MIRFRDRREAGRRLLALLRERGVAADVVLGIPRGGLLVAEAVARGLGVPWDALIARKIGAPQQPELAIGAVTRFGVVWNREVVETLGISAATLEELRAGATAEVERREAAYRAGRPAEGVAGRRVLLVDDGLATGATMAAAAEAVRQARALAVAVAAPVASPEAVARLERMGTVVLTLAAPAEFFAVGWFYDDFAPVSDQQCIDLLAGRPTTRG